MATGTRPDPKWLQRAAWPVADADAAAVAGLIMAVIVPPVGIILSATASRQAIRRQMRPSPVAGLGLILGIAFTVIFFFVLVAAVTG